MWKFWQILNVLLCVKLTNVEEGWKLKFQKLGIVRNFFLDAGFVKLIKKLNISQWREVKAVVGEIVLSHQLSWGNSCLEGGRRAGRQRIGKLLSKKLENGIYTYKNCLEVNFLKQLECF